MRNTHAAKYRKKSAFCVASKKAILVTGSKGGVGTTTVALNLGVQLANATKKRVALLDLARPFGQISLMLDFEPRFTVLDALERIQRLDDQASHCRRGARGCRLREDPNRDQSIEAER